MSKARNIADLLAADGDVKASKLDGYGALKDLSNVGTLASAVQTQLVGATGAGGATGAQGATGATGATGPAGTPSTSLGTVGSYGLLWDSVARKVTAGSTLAGSSLKWASAFTYVGNNGGPSGTWRCMGLTGEHPGGSANTTKYYRVTLWVRIS